MSQPGNFINPTHSNLHRALGDALQVNGYSRTPNGFSTPANLSHVGNITDGELGADEDSKLSAFKGIFVRTEAKICALFRENEEKTGGESTIAEDGLEQQNGESSAETQPQASSSPKKLARKIDEDDYDDSEESDEGDNPIISPLKSKSTGTSIIPKLPLPVTLPGIPTSLVPPSKDASSSTSGKTSEDVRKRLEEDKKATEDAAKRSFHTMFYTLENDRDAMSDQKKLEESDRQVDVEMSGNGSRESSSINVASGATQQGTLSQANLGASSLTLKHLIARIDAKRDQVRASDAELRSLMSEVRKNRSKWASEDRVGQEELYEAAEKVLSELKAMTEHSTAFLTRVNKREAPDYYNVIKHPMDLGTMTKKLKAVQYKSKHDFVDDLNLIWANCLKYNANPEHFLRRHALFMRKETEKLVPLIPVIIIRDRADVEAEERRLQNGDADIDGGEDSDDEPIIASRGRKAPGKKAKKGSTARKAPVGALEGSPAVEPKPVANGLSTNLKHEYLRADSDTAMEGSQNGMATPPPGMITPAGVNGIFGHGASSSQPDIMDVDGFDSASNAVNGHGSGQVTNGNVEEVEYEDLEFKTWKQVTKRDRALVAAERHRLFKGDRLAPDEPALLRKKLGMRRWLRKQKQAAIENDLGKRKADAEVLESEEAGQSGETLAEGMEGDEERVLPDYYDTLAAMPELSDRLRWIEDAEGQIQDATDEFLRVVPKGLFVSPESSLTKKLEGNMKQMQDTRKICSKIGVVKQMQLQSHMYQNQFQKYEPERFVEHDIEPHVMSDDGPVMSPWACRAALQRSVSKIFFHAGFDECQPSALETITDIAGDFFTKLSRTLGDFKQAPKIPILTPVHGSTGESEITWKDRFTMEEIILHSLHENGSDIEALENYVKDDVERLGTKLSVMHERMKSHLADLLRPALSDAGPDGSYAFNDGSEQFVGGDFAEDLDEDFFGFKELGLDKEFGLASLSVPLHLLQNRMHVANQAQNPNPTSTLPSSLAPLPPLPPLTIESLPHHIGLIQNFFLAKLHANNDNPLQEDDDLPQKHRLPKPRLPPSGKISSPRKRPQREPGPGKGHPRKKMKLGNEEGGGKGGGAAAAGKVKGGVGMERMESARSRDEGVEEEAGKEKRGEVGGMMSPESLEAT